MDPMYIYGGNTGLNYEELFRRQQIAQALANQKKGWPKNIGEGIASMGADIGEVLQYRALQRLAQEQRNAELASGKRVNALPGAGASPLAVPTVGGAIPGGAPRPAAPVGAVPQQVPTTKVPASEAPAGAIPGATPVVPQQLSSADDDEDVKSRLAALLTPAPGGAQENPMVAGPVGGPALSLDEPVQLAALNPGTMSDAPPPGAQRLLPKPPVSDLPDIPAWGSPVQPPSQTPMPPFEPIKTNPFQRRAPGGSDLGGPQLAALPPAAPVTDENPPTPTDIQPAPTRIAQGPVSSNMFSSTPIDRQLPPGAGPALTQPAWREKPPEAWDIAPPAVPAEPRRPDRVDPSPRQQAWDAIRNDARYSPAFRQRAKDAWEAEEKRRVDLQTAVDADYTTKYQYWQTKKDERDKFDRETPIRRAEHQLKRLEIARALAKDPLDIQKLGVDIENAKADLAEKRFKATLHPQERLLKEDQVTQSGLNIKKTEKELAERKEHVINGQVYRETEPGSGKYQLAEGIPKEDKLTETQSKSYKALQRATVASSIIGDGDALRGLTNRVIKGVQTKVSVGSNYWLTPEFKDQYDAALRWATAVLRDESGAQISLEEAKNKLQQYFPVPGDSERQVAIKRAARQAEEASLYHGMGDKKTLVDTWRANRASKRTDLPEMTEQYDRKNPKKRRRVIGGHWVTDDEWD